MVGLIFGSTSDHSLSVLVSQIIRECIVGYKHLSSSSTRHPMKSGFHWKKSRVIELLDLYWGNQTIQMYSGFESFALNTVLFGLAT